MNILSEKLPIYQNYNNYWKRVQCGKFRGGHACRGHHSLRACLRCKYTHRNLFQILLNQPEIRLYLPFSDWFGSKRMSVWFQFNRKNVNTIWFRVDLIRFPKKFSVCTACRVGPRAEWGPGWVSHRTPRGSQQYDIGEGCGEALIEPHDADRPEPRTADDKN